MQLHSRKNIQKFLNSSKSCYFIKYTYYLLNDLELPSIRFTMTRWWWSRFFKPVLPLFQEYYGSSSTFSGSTSGKWLISFHHFLGLHSGLEILYSCLSIRKGWCKWYACPTDITVISLISCGNDEERRIVVPGSDVHGSDGRIVVSSTFAKIFLDEIFWHWDS